MKKNLALLAIIGVAMITLSGCGKDPITVVGADGTEYESVKACCAANDYEAAHELLSKIKKEYDSTTDGMFDQNCEYRENLYDLYCEGKSYLFTQESHYLISVGDDAAQKRLFYLLDEKYSDLVEFLHGTHFSGVVDDISMWNDDVRSFMDLALAEDNEDLVIALIGKIKFKDPPPMIGFYSNGGNYHGREILEYNQSCSKVLDAAIVKGNQSLAKRVLSLYKENIDFINNYGEPKARKAPDGTLVPSGECYTWKTDTDRKAAQKKYEKAFGKDSAN